MSDLDLKSFPGAKYGANALKGTGGDFGEQLAAELHGKWYTAARNGRLFIDSLAHAGGVIPVNASGLVSTFSLWNPAGSGVVVELYKYLLGLSGTTTAVIGNIGLVEQLNVGSAIAVPGTLTAVAPAPAMRGGSAASAVRFYSALTHVGTPSFLMTLGLSFGTTGATPGPAAAVHDFDGSVLLMPGTIISTVSNAAQTQAMAQTLIHAEWPL